MIRKNKQIIRIKMMKKSNINYEKKENKTKQNKKKQQLSSD